MVAEAALYRAEELTRRLSGALGEIGKVAATPCSPPYLKELRRIALTHEQVRDAGAYDHAGRWQCSSLLGAIERGLGDHVQALGLVMPLAALREQKADPRRRQRRDYHDDDQKRRQGTTLNVVHCV
jgi:hypothetical protein